MSLREANELKSFSSVDASDFGLTVASLQSAPTVVRKASQGRRSSAYVRFGFKRLFDIIASSAALLLIMPLLPIIMVALLIQDGPSMIFRQQRMGFGGSRFQCLKFRSMALDADVRFAELLRTSSAARTEWEATQKLRSDPRIHRVGHILRKSSLDEIPQLLNVLFGDMSLVGPRPMLPEQVGRYGEAFHAYSSVRPGITGLWQVSGRNTLTFDERVSLDARYSEDVTFWGDVRILARTVVVVLMGHGSC